MQLDLCTCTWSVAMLCGACASLHCPWLHLFTPQRTYVQKNKISVQREIQTCFILKKKSHRFTDFFFFLTRTT